MEGQYEILRDGEPVGRAVVKRHGLYYHFSCRCPMERGVIVRIVAVCDGSSENLGICVPIEGELGIETKVPVKHFGIGKPEFRLLPKDAPLQREPVAAPEQPAPQQGDEADAVAEPPEDAPEPSPLKSFVSVREDEPFEQLDMLEHGVLHHREGDFGILFEE